MYYNTKLNWPIVIIAFIGMCYFAFTHPLQSGNNHLPLGLVTKCGLVINEPIEGENVSSPFTIGVEVANDPTFGCTWNASDTQAGSVSASDASGMYLGKISLTRPATGLNFNRTYQYYASFSLNGNPHGIITLTFTEYNPNNKSNPNTLSFPVYVK